VRPYAIAGIIIAPAVTGAALWEEHIAPSASGQNLIGWGGFGHRLSSPQAAIGLALLVLAWAERNRALLFLTLGYLAVVLLPITFGWGVPTPSWHFLPQLATGGSVLLFGGIGFALDQRPLRSPAP
jgi:heme A synthase